MAVVIGSVGIAMAVMAWSASDDPAGRFVLAGFAVVCLAVAARAPLLGLWIEPDRIVVRNWLRTSRAALSEVSRLDLVERRGMRYPAVLLDDGSHLPVPGQEVGVIFEANDFQPGWAVAADDVNRRLLRNRTRRADEGRRWRPGRG
ncbi:MAG: hypothetical protein ACOYOQ_14180 [Microthrixaceae bacterium]